MPSGFLIARPQRGNFEARFSTDPLGPVSEVCSLFSNRDLSSTYERQPDVIGIAYNILGVSWTTMTKDLNEDLLALVMGFLFIITLVGALSVHMKKILFYTLTYVIFMYFN